MATLTMPRRAWVEQVMGLPVSIHLRGPGVRDGWVADAVAAAYDELRAVDALFSTYRADSEVSRVNAGDLRLADAHPMLREVAALCDEAVDRTDGCFDARLPSPHGGTWWDPSGVVKGWVTDRVAARLSRLGGHDVSVNAGGDLALAPGRPDSTPWRIGIDDPDHPGRMLTVVAVCVGGVATSGTAARGRHIHDPRTGEPADGGLVAVTVAGPDPAWAEVWSKVLFLGGRDAIRAEARARGLAAWWVREDGELEMTAAARALTIWVGTEAA